jgi:uncharacterized cupredoxin-like copper-binding protein
VEEDKIDVVDEAEDIAPSTTATLTRISRAGSYVIICNIPALRAVGMHAAFTVS